MQVLDAKRGCVISTTEAISDCPECGALRASSECEFCGWTEPTAEHMPAPQPIEPPTPQKAEDRFKSHIDAGNDLICVVCGGDREEIDGLLQCPVCGPVPGTELPVKPRVAVNELPNIDDKLPADPRCPSCLAEAEAAARVRSEIPVEVGERAIVVDYGRGGAIMLVCPVCNAEEELVPGRKGVQETHTLDASPTPQTPIVTAFTGVNEQPPAPSLEVKRRKKA